MPLVARRRALAYGATGAVALLLVATAVTAAVSWYAADRLVHPPRVVDDQTPADRGIPFERVAFLSADGVPLVGWWMPVGDAPAATVVFLHGYGASKQQALAVAGFLHRAGFHVLAFDFRAHGESGGDHTTVGVDEVRDVQGALAWLAMRPEVDPGRLALFGWSMGAATALNAAPDLPQVRALVADSSFTSLGDVAARTLHRFTNLPERPFGPMTLAFASWMTGENPAQEEPLQSASQVRRPILFIQGLADALLLPDDGATLARAAGDDGHLWLVPDAPHLDAHRARPHEYEQRVVAFLVGALS